MKRKIVLLLAVVGIILGAYVAYQAYFGAPSVNFERRNVSTSEMIGIFENATATGDETLCEPIAQYDLREDCKYRVLMSQKGDSLTLKDCKTISDSVRKDMCILELGFRGQLTTTSTCKNDVDGIPAKARCYAYVAAYLKDALICENIMINSSSTDAWIFQMIKDNCYTGVARATANGIVCKNIGDEKRKTDCEIQAAVGSGKPAACEVMETAESRDSCYYQMAVSLGNPSVCSSISTSEMQEDCFRKRCVKTLCQR